MSLNEEQQTELEALASIYGDDYRPGASPSHFVVKLLPDATGESPNHVGVDLHVTFKPDYPAAEPPDLRVEGTKGLNEEKLKALTKVAMDAAAANLGMPAVYAIAEEIRTWLQENNQPPDEGSAFDEMMKRQKAKEKGDSGAGAGKYGSAFSKEADPSLAATRGTKVVISAKTEDEAIRRKREGTPVTVETFMAWRAKFEAEMAQKKADEAAAAALASGQKGAAAAAADMAQRLTGRQLFERDSSLATSDVGAEDAAAAAVAAQGAGAPGDASGFVVDEGLFGDDDLDDLDDDDDEDDEYEGEDDDEDDDDEFEGDSEDDDDDEEGEMGGGAGGKSNKAGVAKAGAGGKR